tara:strand:+ start:76 stop:624 length:549 start_codon:yes stop_codon:yes gene_type:complete
MPVNYKNGIIYRIYDNTNGDVYYGSTANILRFRMSKHKSDAKSDSKNKMYKSKSIILNDDYCYGVVEVYPCNSKKELETRERYYIENFTCVNKYVPTRTPKERREDHKEDIKQYYQDNKEEKQEKRNKYYADNKEEIQIIASVKHNCLCGGKYTYGHKQEHFNTKKHQKYITDNAPICIECK